MIAILIAALALTQPAMAGADQVGPLLPAETCDAAPAQRLIGRAASPRTVELAKRISKATKVRTVRADGVVTMEYAFGRLNIITNERGVILAIRCG
jgi:hypothetical protein